MVKQLPALPSELATDSRVPTTLHRFDDLLEFTELTEGAVLRTVALLQRLQARNSKVKDTHRVCAQG